LYHVPQCGDQGSGRLREQAADRLVLVIAVGEQVGPKVPDDPVLVGGRDVVRAGRCVTVDLDGLRAEATARRDHMLRSRCRSAPAASRSEADRPRPVSVVPTRAGRGVGVVHVG
jgi:hypothetical protein